MALAEEPERGSIEVCPEQVPGMKIYPDLITKMKDVEEPKEEGIRMAVDLIRKLRETPGIAGIHLMPPRCESVMPRLLKESGIL